MCSIICISSCHLFTHQIPYFNVYIYIYTATTSTSTIPLLDTLFPTHPPKQTLHQCNHDPYVTSSMQMQITINFKCACTNNLVSKKHATWHKPKLSYQYPSTSSRRSVWKVKWASGVSWGHITYSNLTASICPWPNRMATMSLISFLYSLLYLYLNNGSRTMHSFLVRSPTSLGASFPKAPY